MESIQNIEELNHSNLKVALSILFTNNEILTMLSSYHPLCSSHQFSCIIAQTIALSHCYTNKQPLNVSFLSNSIDQYLQKIDFQSQLKESPGPIDLLSAILINFHCFSVNNSCYDSEDIVFAPCKKPCILHKFFSFEVDERVQCGCGRSWVNSWEKNNICQYFKIEGLFEAYDEVQSKMIAMLPKYKFSEPGISGNSPKMFKKMIKILTSNLEEAKYDRCQVENCPYSDARMSFFVNNAPEFYIIDLVNSGKNLKHLESYLATISIMDRFRLRDIYKGGESKDYALQGVIFFGKGYYYARFNGRFWEFPGLHPESGWYELIQETLVMNLHPVSVIYRQGMQNRIPDFGSYKLLKLEQAAVQCDNFVETYKTPFVSEGHLYSGFFIEKKIKGFNKITIEEEKKESPGISRYESKISPVKNDYYSKARLSEISSVKDDYSSKAWFKEESPQRKSAFVSRLSPVKDEYNSKVQHKEESSWRVSGFESKPSPANKDYNFADQAIKWECKCGELNLDSFEVCTKCSEIKPGLSGWVCKSCSFRNDNYFSICTACYECKGIVVNEKVEESKEKDESMVQFDEDTKNSWTCACDCENTNDFEVCQHCYSLKPGIDGWVCVACKAKNETGNYRCNVCDTYKSGNFKPDQQFWVCEKCRSAISAKYTFCDTCMYSGNYDDVGSRFKTCKKCNEKFPASANKCYWCQEDYKSESESRREEKEIWTCEYCQSENKLNSYSCEHCKRTRPTIKIITSKNKCPECHRSINPITEQCTYCERSDYSKYVQVKPRDSWECSSCKTSNEDWKPYCTTCHKDKGDLRKSSEYELTRELDSWNCWNCSRKNSNIHETICKFCQTRRPENSIRAGEKKKRCIRCHIELSEVLCKTCKKIANFSDIRCQICNSDISGIMICYECSQDNEPPEKIYQ